MINSLEQLVAKSGDSQLLNYDYSSGRLTFQLQLDELDCVVRFRVFTSAVAASAVKTGSAAHSTCRIETLPLEEHLALQNGIYVPSSDLGTMMKEMRGCLHLAFGLRNSEAKMLLRLIGHTVLLACPIEHRDKIEWSVV